MSIKNEVLYKKLYSAFLIGSDKKYDKKDIYMFDDNTVNSSFYY